MKKAYSSEPSLVKSDYYNPYSGFLLKKVKPLQQQRRKSGQSSIKSKNVHIGRMLGTDGLAKQAQYFVQECC